MSYVSGELFHFNGYGKPSDHDRNYHTLKLILKQGCISSPPHLKGWGEISITSDGDRSILGELEGEGMINPSMVCFADIPPKYLGIHCRKYGYCGISLKREFLVKYGARPVAYVPVDGDLSFSNWGCRYLRNLESAFRVLDEWEDELEKDNEPKSISISHRPETIDERVALVKTALKKDTLSFLKPFRSELPDDHIDNFYMEREWRMLGNAYFAKEIGAVEHVCVPGEYVEDLGQEFPDYKDRIVDTFKLIDSN